ncbi:MAG: YfbR-like 5'-deoxynucleotidase [Alphaproteobacteria bacterium]
MTKQAWQRMLSGRRLDILNPSPSDIEMADIAHGLCRVARWNGQTKGDYTYSVAQHSLLVEKIMSDLYPTIEYEYLLMALIHDASEYVIGDMISPFKKALGNEFYDIEENIQQTIHISLGLPSKTPVKIKKIIKECDLYSAHIEAVQIAGFNEDEAVKQISKAPKTNKKYSAKPLAPNEVYEKFMKRFEFLLKKIS